MMFYILSLERSRRDHPVWWGPHKMGYTYELESAGKYTREEAQDIFNTDIYHNDLPIPCEMAEEAWRQE